MSCPSCLVEGIKYQNHSVTGYVYSHVHPYTLELALLSMHKFSHRISIKTQLEKSCSPLHHTIEQHSEKKTKLLPFLPLCDSNFSAHSETRTEVSHSYTRSYSFTP